MRFLLFLSESIIPLILFLIIAYGLLNRQNVYQDFLKGAKDGLFTVIDILPTLIGLLTSVGILRASGFFDFLSDLLKRLMGPLHFPTELIPASIVKCSPHPQPPDCFWICLKRMEQIRLSGFPLPL